MSKVSQHEALVYVMVVMSAVDNAMTDKELSQIGSVVRGLPVFKGYDDDCLIDTARDCQKILAKDNGLSMVLELAREAIAPHLYDTAYALAVEIAAVDLKIQREELRFLQMLRDTFDLDKLTVAAIERGALARYRN